MNSRLLSTILITTSILGATTASADDYNNPPSTYPGMEELEPDPENLELCQELPMFENFSDPTHYDGTGYLPVNWVTTGSTIWRTANTDDLRAANGEYYMISPDSEMLRDERAYTPFFYMEKGVVYTLAFSSYQTSLFFEDASYMNKIIVKVGTQQDSDFIPVTMGYVQDFNVDGVWSKNEFQFCPAESGAYCFCFELEGEVYSGYAAVDAVSVSSPLNPLPPDINFVPFGIFNARDLSIISLGNDPTYFVNYTPNGDPLRWSIDGEDMNMLSREYASTVFNASGQYDVELSVSNASGELSRARSFKVTHYSEPASDLAFFSYDANTARIVDRKYIPYFPTDRYGLDYVSGPNHYYNIIGELYQVPWNAELTIDAVSYVVGSIRYCPTPSTKDFQQAKPVRIKFIGTDGAGHPDDSKVYGNYSFQMVEMFSTGLHNQASGDAHTINLPRPVTITGPFFLVFEFSDDLIIDQADTNTGRTFVGFNVIEHAHQLTTLYCKPYKAPPFIDIELDEWCPVSDLNSKWKGLGLYTSLHASYKPGTSGVNTVEEDAKPSCRIADGSIVIDNAGAGCRVNVYAIDGSLMTSAVTAAGTTAIDASALSSGIYLVTVGNHTYRIAK